MDGQEKIIQSLNKQQEGKHLFFTLYKQEKENIVSNEGLQLPELGKCNNAIIMFRL